jgi:diguanylate cyclase (GGDEF)-like protein
MDEEIIRVFLVDDDEDDYVLTRDLLAEAEGARFELEWVDTYEAALEAMGQAEHDVYLVDYRLGQRDGLDLLHAAIAGGCEAPMIILTGRGDHAVDVAAMRAGAADYLDKGELSASLLERSIRYAIERRQTEEQLHYLATHDALTGLPNRRLFNDRLTLEMAHVYRNQQMLAVILLDLDHFKNVNDTLGHSVGDQLLQVVAERLTSLLRKSDTIARMGGDEFMLICPEMARGEAAAKVAHKILDAIRKPFVCDGHQLHVTTSIGIALYPDDGEDVDMLMKKADIAMYHAKEKGRDSYQRYTGT